MEEGVCPSCGKPMMKGFLVAESFVEGAKWTKEKTKLALGGEVLVKPDGFGNVYINGYRCPACRFVFLRY
ncbi:MAG: PF20097 family protein [Candidatus Thermoplasmatota archaeon]